ncbi:MAG: ABC transporter permease [Sarcina sp.]
MNLKNCLKVFKFTIVQQIKGKAFKVSTTIILLSIFILVALGNIIPAIMSKSDNSAQEQKNTQNEIKITTAYYKNNTDLKVDISKNLKEMYPDLNIVESKDNITKTIEKVKDSSVLICVNQTNDSYSIDLYKPKSSELVSNKDADLLNASIAAMFKNKFLENNGLSPKQISMVDTPFQTHTYIAGEDNSFESIIITAILPTVVCILLFYIIYFYGYWVANSIVAEKTSRVMELLLTSTRPLELITGKCVGMGVLAIAQFISILIVAIISFKLSSLIVTSFINSSAHIFNISALFANINPMDMVCIIVYFILGYTLYSVLNALAGATVSKLEDLSIAIMPVSFISIIGFYLAMIGVSSPGSLLSKIALYVPFSSPFYLPTAILSENLAISQILISLAILIATIILLIFFTSRVYSVVILQTGNRVTISDLFHIFKKEK